MEAESHNFRILLLDPKFKKPAMWNSNTTLSISILFYVLDFYLFNLCSFFLDTDEEVVNNLPGGLKTIVNLILVVKALLSYPLPYYATCEILEKELFRGKPDTQFPTIWSVDGELKVWGLGKVIHP